VPCNRGCDANKIVTSWLAKLYCVVLMQLLVTARGAAARASASGLHPHGKPCEPCGDDDNMWQLHSSDQRYTPY
jgi:hypothetical protein